MKPFLRKHLSLENSARTVFFTLTLWLVGYLFLIAFRLITWDWGYYGNVWLNSFFVTAMWLPPGLYALASLRFFIPFYWRDCEGWQLRTTLAITGGMLLVTANWALAGIHTGRELWLAAIFFFLILPAGMAIRGGLRNLPWFGIYLVAGTGGVLMAAAEYGYINFSYFNSPETTGYPFKWLSDFVIPDGGRWFIYTAVTLLLSAIGYVAFGICLARTAGLSPGRIFNRRIGWLWSMAAALYLITYLMSLPVAAARQAELTRLEKSFNFPLSAAEQASYPNLSDFNGTNHPLIPGNPDNEFSTPHLRFVEISPEVIGQLAATAPQFEHIVAEITGQEAAFADSKRGKDILSSNWFWKQFYPRLEIEFLLALRREDLAAALRYENLMRTCSQFYIPTPVINHPLCFGTLENLRLDKIELLLESGLVPDAGLDELDHNLQQSFALCDKIGKKTKFAILLNQVHDWDQNSAGLLVANSIDGKIRIVPLTLLEWLVPAFRWYRLRGQTDFLKHCDTDDISIWNGWKPREEDRGIFVLDSAGKQFRGLSDRYQLMRHLIDCEREKRRTGKYPNSLPAGRANPNWRYHNGEEKITVTHLLPGPPPKQEQYDSPFVDVSVPQNKSGIHAESREVSTPVISILSVGPDGKDENGSGDNVLVIMRVKP